MFGGLDQDGRGVGCGAHLPTDTSKIHLCVEQLSQNIYWTLAEDFRLPKGHEKWVGQKKNKKKTNGTTLKLELLYSEANCQQNKNATYWVREDSCKCYIQQGVNMQNI